MFGSFKLDPYWCYYNSGNAGSYLGGVSDGRGFAAEVALDHVLVALAADVDDSLQTTIES
jgi:hypothetical protein